MTSQTSPSTIVFINNIGRSSHGRPNTPRSSLLYNSKAFNPPIEVGSHATGRKDNAVLTKPSFSRDKDKMDVGPHRRKIDEESKSVSNEQQFGSPMQGLN